MLTIKSLLHLSGKRSYLDNNKKPNDHGKNPRQNHLE
jgi:hypothetical protein